MKIDWLNQVFMEDAGYPDVPVPDCYGSENVLQLEEENIDCMQCGLEEECLNFLMKKQELKL